MRVVIYTRLSRDRDGTATATARQEADCRALANAQGWTVLETYEDSDFSGYKRGLVRPAYERMLDRLDGGGVDAIMVWKLDRLTRQPGQFEHVVTALERNGARLVSVHEGADMTSPAGLAMLRVGMAFGAMESETISLRTRRAKEDIAEAGIPNGGGLRPFGLNRERTEVVEDEAVLIREAAARIIAGESVSGICREWRARGVLTTRGNHWMPTALRRMLKNPRLTGARVHKGRVIPSEVIPAILEHEVHAQLVRALERPGGGRMHTWRLTGLVVCSRCGHRMIHFRRQDGNRVYRCQKHPGGEQCGGMVITAAPLEDVVGREIAAHLDDPNLAVVLGGEVAGRLSQQLADARARLTTLTEDHYVHGLVGREDFVRAEHELRGLIRVAEAALGRATTGDALSLLDPGETVLAAWRDRPAAWGNRLARAVLHRIVVLPAPRRGSNRFDPGRVRLEWFAQEGGDAGEGLE